jgi:hypothetical protein
MYTSLVPHASALYIKPKRSLLSFTTTIYKHSNIRRSLWKGSDPIIWRPGASASAWQPLLVSACHLCHVYLWIWFAGRRGLLDQVGIPIRYPSDNATTTAVVDGTKFTVIFCVLKLCGKRDCYCCETGDYCYYSRKQCQANCDPKCPPPRLPLQ